MDENELVKILLKFSFLRSSSPLSIIFALLFAPTIKPSPFTAVNGDGLIVGANSNAKIMLNGLEDLKNENFNKIFTNSFSSIASDLLNNKTLKITDHLGSSVFVVKSQIFKENKFLETKKENKKSTCKNCEDTKIKREKCTLIRSTFNETNNISATSRKLGVSRTTIYKHLQ